MSSPRDSSPIATIAAGALFALLAGLMIVSSETLLNFFNHPLRTLRLGDVAPTTVPGVMLFRFALALSTVALPAGIYLLLRAPAGLPRESRRDPLLLWATVAAIVAAVVLRLPRLTESLWFDEIAALYAYVRFGPGPIIGNYYSQANHIGHSLLAWCSIEIYGGIDQIALRLPALVASIVAIPAFAALGRHVCGTRFAAIVAACLGAAMPVLVLEGAESRGYSLMILCSALSTLWLLKALDSPRPGPWLLGWAVAIAFGAWCHMVTPLVAVGQALWLTVERTLARRSGRVPTPPTSQLLIAAGFALLLALLLYSPAIPDIIKLRSEFISVEGDEPGLLGPEGLHALMQLGGAWSWWTLPGLALFAFGLIAAWRNPLKRRALGLSLTGLLIALLLIQFSGSWTYSRFLLFVMPAAVIAMTIAIDFLAARSRSAAGVALALVAAGWAGDLITRPSKQPIQDAVEFVADTRAPEDAVATIGLNDNAPAFYGVVYEIDIADSGMLGANLEAIIDVPQLRWIIILYPNSVDESRWTLLQAKGFVEARRFPGWVDWTNGDVVVMQRTNPTPPL